MLVSVQSLWLFFLELFMFTIETTLVIVEILDKLSSQCKYMFIIEPSPIFSEVLGRLNVLTLSFWHRNAPYFPGIWGQTDC